jgi:O-Antigen ligase
VKPVPPSKSDSGSTGEAWFRRAAGAVPLVVLALLWGTVLAKREPALQAMAAVMASLVFAFPSAGLLACAAIIPPICWLEGTIAVAGPRKVAETLVLAFFLGWLLRRLVRSGPRPGRSLRTTVLPAVLFGAAVVLSAAAELWALQPEAGHALFRPFVYRPAVLWLASAALSIEGVGLFVVAATLVRRSAVLGRALVATVVGASVVVAALNIGGLLTTWRTTGAAWPRLMADFLTVRTNSAFPDPNSAGSYLAMGLVAALGLALEAYVQRSAAGRAAAARWRSLGWLLAAAAIAIGLWLTGSRSAFVAVVAAPLVMFTLVPRGRRWLAWSSVTALVLGLVVLLPSVVSRFDLPTSSGRSLRQATAFRAETAMAAVRMFVAHPVFGVGAGRFFGMSGEYLAPAFRSAVPHENAHNNFLQVLAELGMVGFVPFVWMIGAVGTVVWKRRRAGPLPRSAAAGAAGLSAFVLTWFGGHPLLVAEAAYPFWLLLGVVTGLVCGGAPSADPDIPAPSVSDSSEPR